MLILYMFEKTKKKIMTVKLVVCIIINFLKLREIQTSVMSGGLINKLSLVKDLSKMTFDIITLNIISILCNSLPLYNRIKKIFKKNKD